MYWRKLLKRVKWCAPSPVPWSIEQSIKNYDNYKKEWESNFDHYVYVFSEPVDGYPNAYYGGKMEGGEFVMIFGSPFYVGKGSGRRCLDHFKIVKDGQKTPFYKKLKQVLDKNPHLTPWDLVTVVKFFKSEEDAYNMESRLIKELGSGLISEIKNGPLMNIKLFQHQIPHTENKGEKNQMAKLTDSNVLEIYRMIKEGATNAAIAEKFNVHPRYVSLIRHGKRWSHLFDLHLKGLELDSSGQGKFHTFHTKVKIIMEIKSGVTNQEIANKYGTNVSNFSRVRNKKIWKNVWKYVENQEALDIRE